MCGFCFNTNFACWLCSWLLCVRHRYCFKRIIVSCAAQIKSAKFSFNFQKMVRVREKTCHVSVVQLVKPSTYEFLSVEKFLIKSMKISMLNIFSLLRNKVMKNNHLKQSLILIILPSLNWKIIPSTWKSIQLRNQIIFFTFYLLGLWPHKFKTHA